MKATAKPRAFKPRRFATKRHKKHTMDGVLVSMPFAEVQRPSIALGLLHASLAGTEIQSEVVYGNFGLAERIGLVAYQAMQLVPTDHLLGEWCFANCLFPTSEEKDDEY